MNETITGDSPMQAVLQVFPGAQRALFRKYHIGGCSSCGFQPEETLARVCERNGDLPVTDVLEQILQSHEEDARILIEPSDLAKRLEVDLLEEKTIASNKLSTSRVPFCSLSR